MIRDLEEYQRVREELEKYLEGRSDKKREPDADELFADLKMELPGPQVEMVLELIKAVRRKTLDEVKHHFMLLASRYEEVHGWDYDLWMTMRKMAMEVGGKRDAI
jgi:hypothetical protein